MSTNPMAPPDGETGETHDQATSSGAATSPPGNSTSTAKSAQGPAYVVVDRRDFAHAELLAHLLNNQVRWCPEEKTWRVYRQGYWAAESEEAVAKMASDSLQACYGQEIAKATSKADIETLVRKITDVCIHGRIMGILGFLKGWPNVATHQNEWDRNGWLLNLKNGTADLRTIKMRSHKPEDLLTKIAPVRFDPEATAPAWERHLDRFLPNRNIRRQVKRDLGKALVGAVLDEALTIWHGSGGNGKTTTIRVLMSILGDYAIKPMQGLLVQHRWDPHPTVMADLAGKRVVFATETERGQKLSEALVKDLSGGDTLRARRMYQDSFEFPRTFSIFLITNDKPIVSGRDRGIWRRLRLVPWEQEIDEKDKHPQDQVVSELLAEASGILNWLLDGLHDWQADTHWLAPEVTAATNAYQAESDPLADFLADCCAFGARYRVPKALLFERYKAWAEANFEHVLSRRTFTRLLISRDGIGEDTEGHQNVRVYTGIKLAEAASQQMRADASTSAISFSHEQNMEKSHSTSARMCSQPELAPDTEQPERPIDTEQPEPSVPPPDTEQGGKQRRARAIGEHEAAIAEFVDLAIARNFEPFRLDGYRTIVAGSEAWQKSAATAELDLLQQAIAALRAAREKPPRVGDAVWCLNADGSLANAEPLKIIGVEIGPNLEPYAMLDGEDGVTGWPLLRCFVAQGDPMGCSV